LGIAHAIGLAREFAGGDPIAIVLGDNILHGSLAAFASAFAAGDAQAGAVLKQVSDPERFGVAELGSDGELLGFEEKPKQPKSDLIPIGVYFFRPSVFDVIQTLKPSPRGEFEITDLLNHYLGRGALVHTVFQGDWMDAGTVDALLESSSFAAEFAGETPLEATQGVDAVEAEPIQPRR
jgi:glucose-1-phosphate thymidylyltransferase